MDEKKAIEQALKSPQPVVETQRVCRKILCSRLDEDEENTYDLSVMRIVKGIFKKMEFSLEWNIIPTTGETPPLSQKPLLVCGTAGLMGICSTVFGGGLLKIFGVLLTATSFFCLGRAKEKNERPPSVSTSVYIKTTEDEILQKINVIYKEFHQLLIKRQLDGKYLYLLKFLQKEYAHSEDKEYTGEIADLLDTYGYRLVNYTGKNSNMFTSFEANVPEVTTVMPAVVYKGADDIILEGVVNIPKQ